MFSHTFDNVGRHFKNPLLDDFGQKWVRLFSTSHKAKIRWKEQTGQAVKSFSETRWWLRWEVYQQPLLLFGDVPSFLCHGAEGVAPQLTGQLFAIINDPVTRCCLKLVLAVIK